MGRTGCGGGESKQKDTRFSSQLKVNLIVKNYVTKEKHFVIKSKEIYDKHV
jgi:ribosome assembly protein YihI (activator of Der GTPase)